MLHTSEKKGFKKVSREASHFLQRSVKCSLLQILSSMLHDCILTNRAFNNFWHNIKINFPLVKK